MANRTAETGFNRLPVSSSVSPIENTMRAIQRKLRKETRAPAKKPIKPGRPQYKLEAAVPIAVSTAISR